MADDVRTTCAYCGVGCGVLAGDEDRVRGDAEHPANFGRLCSKGSALGETLGLEERLLTPRIAGREAGWDEALDLVARRLSATIAQYGPDSVAFYVSGQFLTEDYYVANKLMKGFIGSGNIDTNSRLCMASSVAGHRRAFGEDVVPGCYEDFDETDLAILVGSNTAWCHPILYQRLLAARATARHQDRRHRSAPHRHRGGSRSASGAEARHRRAAVQWLARSSRGQGGTGSRLHRCRIRRVSRQRSRWRTPMRGSIDKVAVGCGLAAADVARFYDWFAATERSLTVYSQGVNQSAHGTDKVNAIINVHLATGRIGRPGLGPFSVTGQPNAMGGREVGGLANQLAAHMAFEDAGAVDRVRRFWNAPGMATRPGLKAIDLFEAVGDGRIKALWIAGTNPAASLPDAGRVRAALKRCEFVVVSDVTATDTTRHAHVLLPAGGLGREGRHCHELGAAHLAPARLPPLAGRGAARLAHLHRSRAAHGVRGRVSVSHARPRSSANTRPSPHSRMTARGSSISAVWPTCPMRRMTRCRRCNGRCRRTRADGASVRRREILDPGWPRALRCRAPGGAGGSGQRPLSDRAQYRPAARPVAHHDSHGRRSAADGARAGAGDRARARATPLPTI